MKPPLARLAPLALLVAVPVATRLGAQDLDKLARLDPNSRYKVESILDSARVLGLSTEPLLSVIYQGIGLRVDGRRVATATQQKFDAMKTVSSALGASLSVADLSAAADVIQAGVPIEQLKQFRAARAGRPLAYAFVVLGDLITRGVPVDEASSTIAQLWQKGAADADFYGLWRGVEEDILQGQSPGAALQQRARAFPGRAPPSKLPPNGRPETPSS